MAGRPRTATAIQEAKGAFRHDPQRRKLREGEPQPNGPIGDPPDYFDENLTALWFELLGISHPGVLCQADRWTAEMACLLMAKLRAGSINGAELSRLDQLLGKMGMNPSDRSKVSSGKPKEDESDPLLALLRKGKGVN